MTTCYFNYFELLPMPHISYTRGAQLQSHIALMNRDLYQRQYMNRTLFRQNMLQLLVAAGKNTCVTQMGVYHLIVFILQSFWVLFFSGNYIPLTDKKNIGYLNELQQKFHTTFYVSKQRVFCGLLLSQTPLRQFM